MKKIILIVIVFLLFTSSVVEAKDNTTKKIRPRAVVEAINKGDITTLQYYLNNGVNPNGSFWGTQFLTYAIINKQNDSLDLLLESGANPNPSHEIPLLYFSVSEKNQYAVAKLLKVGADINKTYMGRTAKDLAMTYKNKAFIEIFNAYEQNPTDFSPNIYKEHSSIALKNTYSTTKPHKKIEKEQANQITSTHGITPVFDIQAIYSFEKKDPKLINIIKTKPVNDKTYNSKLANDNLVYKKYKNQVTEEYYNLYIILDKLLRANNFQYQNWRLGITMNPEEINASARDNFITINSSLYDSFYQDKDALAFIIAHELSHLVLGHGQISLENQIRIIELEKQILFAINEANKQTNLDYLNNALGNNYNARGNNANRSELQASVVLLESKLNKLYEEERQLEIQADTEAIVLMTRAGYNPEKSKDVIDFLSTLPKLNLKSSSHPSNESRLQNIQENLYLNDINELKAQGQTYIIKTKVSEIKKSSDKATIVLSKVADINKEKYIPISKQQKLINKAYIAYLNNEYPVAQNLFVNAYKLDPNNYIPALYLSYISEYNFKKYKDKTYLKQAKRWVKKAEKNNLYDVNIQKQKEDIDNLYVAIKLEKKQLKQQKRQKKMEKDN